MSPGSDGFKKKGVAIFKAAKQHAIKKMGHGRADENLPDIGVANLSGKIDIRTDGGQKEYYNNIQISVGPFRVATSKEVVRKKKK